MVGRGGVWGNGAARGGMNEKGWSGKGLERVGWGGELRDGMRRGGMEWNERVLMRLGGAGQGGVQSRDSGRGFMLRQRPVLRDEATGTAGQHETPDETSCW